MKFRIPENQVKYCTSHKSRSSLTYAAISRQALILLGKGGHRNTDSSIIFHFHLLLPPSGVIYNYQLRKIHIESIGKVTSTTLSRQNCLLVMRVKVTGFWQTVKCEES